MDYVMVLADFQYTLKIVFNQKIKEDAIFLKFSST